jgi:hypothetical protein
VTGDESGRWLADDEDGPLLPEPVEPQRCDAKLTALQLLAATAAGDRAGAARLHGEFTGDADQLVSALVTWLHLLVRRAGAPVADALLVQSRASLLRLAAERGDAP